MTENGTELAVHGDTIPAVEGGDILPTRADQNAAAVYLAGLAQGSRRTMRGALDSIARLAGGSDALSFPWAALRFQHTAAIRAELQASGMNYNTVNKHLWAMRGVLKAAWQLGQMTAEDYYRAAAVESVKGESLLAGRAITSGEITALMDACAADPSPAGARDGAVIGLLYGCGLRRAELVSLDLADYDPTGPTLAVRSGKGNKSRSIPVGTNGLAAALGDWLAVRGSEPGPLFWALKRPNTGKRLTTQAVYKILQKRAAEAGVSELSPHDFRRTFVGDLLDAGADVVTVQKLAGHSSVNTTARYDRRPESAKRKAVELLHVPYRRRRVR